MLIPDGELALPNARCPACEESAGAEAARKRRRSGLVMLGCSAVLVGIMVLMLRTGFDIESDWDSGDDLFVWVFMGAVSLLSLGLSQLPKLRRSLKT